MWLGGLESFTDLCFCELGQINRSEKWYFWTSEDPILLLTLLLDSIVVWICPRNECHRIPITFDWTVDAQSFHRSIRLELQIVYFEPANKKQRKLMRKLISNIKSEYCVNRHTIQWLISNFNYKTENSIIVEMVWLFFDMVGQNEITLIHDI